MPPEPFISCAKASPAMRNVRDMGTRCTYYIKQLYYNNFYYLMT